MPQPGRSSEPTQDRMDNIQRELRLDAIEMMLVEGHTPRTIYNFYSKKVNGGFSRITITKDIKQVYKERLKPLHDIDVEERRVLRLDQYHEIYRELKDLAEIDEHSIKALKAAKEVLDKISKLEGLENETNNTITEFKISFAGRDDG